MTCAEVVELAGAFALGALEREERAAVEEHLAGPGPHQGCLDAVDRARATAAELSRVLPESRPDPGIWRAIEARTGATSRPQRARIGPWGWAAAAAAVAALAFLQLERLESRRQRAESRQARAELQALAGERDRLRAEVGALAAAGALQGDALALLDRPGTRLVSLEPQPGQRGRGVAIVNVAEGRAVVASSSLAPPPGKTFQLWVIRGAAPPRPAGFLQQTPGGAAGEVDPGLLRGPPPDALAVSLEPAGGSPSPTQVVLVGKVAG
ncbi:MAG TPA: anti-sigma factor [Anaeromyxobacteraceae bacterium]|nr:anti-sigma factor [Anaeromyxobacteraceae bacterium]